MTLAWLVAEDDGARRKIETLLADQDVGLSAIRTTLEEQLGDVDIADPSIEAQNMRDMLVTLLRYV